jgi:regulator of replication initiation timing
MFGVLNPTVIPLEARHIDLKPKKEVKKMKKKELRDELKERMRENTLLKLDVAKLRGEVVEFGDDEGEI